MDDCWNLNEIGALIVSKTGINAVTPVVRTSIIFYGNI